MKNNLFRAYVAGLLFSLFAYIPAAYPYNLRHISKKDGLSNSAILSMCQDADGYMWFGSIDGLNRFDGISIQTYKPANNYNSLSGNLIESIVESGDGVFWVQTNYGLNRFDSKHRSVKKYEGYISNYRLRTSHLCELYFLKEGGLVAYFNASADLFAEIALEGVDYNDVLDYCIDRNGLLWVFGRKTPVTTWQVTRDSGGVLHFERVIQSVHPRNLVFASHEQDTAYFVDESGILYEYDLINRHKSYIADLSKTMMHDEVSAVIKHKNDYFIGFKATGLICLRHTPENSGYDNYKPETINISAGIFCLMNDRRQDIVWIGTDGKGVYAYSDSRYSIRSTPFAGPLDNLKMPVRSILLDDAKCLWLGTKGNGIVRIRNYDLNTLPTADNVDFINTSNSRLTNNSVYSIQKSAGGVIWIGTDGGLDYYDPRDGLMRNLLASDDGNQIKYIHAIREFDGNVLWVASVGSGIYRVELEWRNGRPSMLRSKRYLHAKGMPADNYFYSILRHSDGAVWFGNRGHGAFRYDEADDVLRQVPFRITAVNRTLNDIFSIFEDRDSNLWFGTSYGLVRHTPSGEDEIVYNAAEFPNNTVHGILSDQSGNIWMSTNLGVAMFNLEHRSIRTFDGPGDDQVMEFCNGAFFKDEQSGMLFFGGINGFVTIRERDYKEPDFIPGITFERLSIFGEERNINDFINEKQPGRGKSMLLKHNQNFFSLTVGTLDYINGSNYTFSYKLEGLNANWINNGRSHDIHLTNLDPGSYTLRVKCRNNANGLVSPEFLLDIQVSPPWYASITAKLFYLLFAAGLVCLVEYWIVRRQHIRQAEELDKLEREHQKEVNESKLRFFTNIAHEFCTPLTLIAGPCEQIISHSEDDFVQQHARLIRRNAERMNDLIEELIEFRRIETGNRPPRIEEFDISTLVGEAACDFDHLGEARGLEYRKCIKPGIVWSADREFIRTIVSNLISNAFKYVAPNGVIELRLASDGSQLRIEVMNTGKGIKQEHIDKLFDRYAILEDFENPNNNVVSRNGLGLAILYNLVGLLGGKISVDSVYGEYVTFAVSLPQGRPGDFSTSVPVLKSPVFASNKTYSTDVPLPKYEFDRFKPTVMVIDDDPEMLWLLGGIFSEEYNVIPVSDSTQAGNIIPEVLPNVIISDVMMPGVDGITLTKRIKANPKTSHIPLILISAKHMVDEQIEGIEAGAEMYISKPFDVNYLRTFVRQLMSRKEQLKEYFSSPMSAYETDGGKLTHIEHKRFAQQIFEIINRHIHDPKLSAQMIARELEISPRHLYRRIAEMELQSPADMIRESRLHIARNLLLNSKLTIDEIVFKSGYSNRSSFFRTFLQKYGCTPKEYRSSNRK